MPEGNNISLSAIHKNTTARSGRLGYSLVEIMIGMTILGMVLLACLASLPEMREISYRSDATRLAFTQLNAEIESYRTQTFTQMADTLDAEVSSDANFNTLLSITGSDAYGNSPTGKVTHSSSQTTLNNVTYDVDTFLLYLDVDEQIIETVVVVSWDYLNKVEQLSGSAIFTEDGLSDKKFSIAN